MEGNFSPRTLLYPSNFESYEFISFYKYKLNLNFETKQIDLRSIFDISQTPFLCSSKCGRKWFTSELQTQIPRRAREINEEHSWCEQ